MAADRPTSATLVKGALRRLAQARQEPTPDNFARAYADEAGEPLPADGPLPARARAAVERLVMRAIADLTLRGELSAALMEARYDDLQRALDGAAGASAAQGAAWVQLIDRVARGLERGPPLDRRTQARRSATCPRWQPQRCTATAAAAQAADERVGERPARHRRGRRASGRSRGRHRADRAALHPGAHHPDTVGSHLPDAHRLDAGDPDAGHRGCHVAGCRAIAVADPHRGG